MAKRLKAIRQIKAKREVKDLQGWGIPKGTVLHVMKEGPVPPKSMKDAKRVLLVRVDNGTGHLDLMPETAVHETGDFEEVKAPK